MGSAQRNQNNKIARRGLMLVLSSPSGAGKTTLSRLLLRSDRKVELSISVTTRPKRRGEIDGRDYHFIDRGRFDNMVARGELLEWAEVFGHRYGTPRAPVTKALQAGRDVLFDIDWQGTQQLREKAHTDLVSVFILPPTAKELERRLKRRAQDSKTVIGSRIGRRYGTPRAPVTKALQAGRDVLFDIDWQGTQQLREKARTDLVSVFILPPTAKELERRLKRRAQDSKTVIGSRMAKAAGEMSHWPEYDYVIVNRVKREAFAELRAILAAERLKRERLVGLSDFVRRLQAKL